MIIILHNYFIDIFQINKKFEKKLVIKVQIYYKY